MRCDNQDPMARQSRRTHAPSFSPPFDDPGCTVIAPPLSAAAAAAAGIGPPPRRPGLNFIDYSFGLRLRVSATGRWHGSGRTEGSGLIRGYQTTPGHLCPARETFRTLLKDSTQFPGRQPLLPTHL